MNNTIVKAMILDMDGVLWKENLPIGDLGAIFGTFRRAGINISFATNNATNTIDQYVNRLGSFGVSVNPNQVINSSIAVTNYLLEHYPGGGGVFVIGEAGLLQTLQEHGYYHNLSEPKAVIVAMDRQLTYDKLKIATLLIREGTPFIATNPDRTFPTPEGLVPGAGAIVAAVETASGVKPLILGKPSPEMYRIAISRMDVHPEECMVVGDRLETDIAGGQSIGCKTALVLSGVTTLSEAELWSPKPDIITSNLSTLIKQLHL